MTITINGTTGIAGVDGSAGTPAVQGTDTNTGIFFPAADTIAFGEGGAEVARFDSSGNLGIGTTSPTSGSVLDVVSGTTTYPRVRSTIGSSAALFFQNSDTGTTTSDGMYVGITGAEEGVIWNNENTALRIATNNTERARITSGGDFVVGKTSAALGTAGGYITQQGEAALTVNGNPVLYVNRLTDDGDLVRFFQATTQEGTISVSGTTVSYNGGNLSRWAQMPGTKDDTLVKGTVMSNLDEMNVYTDAEGNQVDNEQLNKVKVSDVEGDVNVAGVFVNWTYDDAHQVDEINMAMTGDMIIRIAQGVVVQKGDLLMSAGDGTAKPQGDDIVRSKTVAKVTSNHVTCTYADGSYCVPCVLMAC